MSHTELTDEPCPKCGASLDVKVKMPEPGQADVSGPNYRRETIKLTRVKECPDCGWTVEL